MRLCEPKVAVVANSTRFQSQADRLAESLPMALESAENADFLLHIGDDGLSLKKNRSSETPLRVDWLNSSLARRARQQQSELLVRALRWTPKQSLEYPIIDACAGLGSDAFILLARGYTVHLFERSPIVHALLHDGAERFFSVYPEMRQRCRIVFADSQHALPTSAVVYLDPMFSETNSKAKPKKSVQYLRSFGTSEGAENLLAIARERAFHRVVVKRSIQAKPLSLEPPKGTLRGKICRFDFY